ncbi:hypothetical protein [Pseudonocardia sp. TRM90224]|uniref:hypothetical protein n=1 Tax=Pseudonocardia sp. TRM90224 TaxID=2812678 RepID=UPI001E2F9312|nr:hypothetical protein [Pseudonocardia sp. TRM90224]
MDATALQDAYRTFLDAAESVAAAGDAIRTPPPGEWDADQILAHIAIINAATIAAVNSVATGSLTTYDNRIAHDGWTLAHVIELSGGGAGLRDRIRLQGEALCALVGSVTSDAEPATLVPTLLVSKDAVLLDQPVPLRDLITGLSDVELPGHAAQLRALLPAGAG